MTNIRHLSASLLVGACLLVLPRASAADDPGAATTSLPAEALKLGEILRSETAKITQQHKDSIKTLPASQQTKLSALQKKLREEGDLEGYLLVENELKRFTEALVADPDPFELVPELPANALVDKPEALRALQDQYLKDIKDKCNARDKRLEDLVRNYTAKMDQVKVSLTIKGRIPEAVAVKKEIERVRAGLEDKTTVSQILSPSTNAVKAQPTTTIVIAETNTTPETMVYGNTPTWANWLFDRTGNITADNFLFAHPDLPDQLAIDFLPKNGRGRIYGRCEVERQNVDTREYTWFGKAIQWKVKDFATLNATIILQSKEISAGQGYGPKAYLVLLGDKGPLGEALEVTMTAKETTLTIAKDPDVTHCTLGWIQGKIKKNIDLPASGTVRVLFGISVRNAGERCDTSISLQ